MSKCFLSLNKCRYHSKDVEDLMLGQVEENKRSYYDMTGKDNIYKYMTGEVIRVGYRKNLDWVGNQTGVFNRDGMLSTKEVEEMQDRLRENKGTIWFGFVSVPKEYGKKIDSPQKCVSLLKYTFIDFCKEAKFYYKDLDLMCCLHSQAKDHIHMHFVFWEKKPIYYKNNNTKGTAGISLSYRFKPIPQRAIDRLKLRIDYFISNEREEIYKGRENSYIRLGKILKLSHEPLKSAYAIKSEMQVIAEALPYDNENICYLDKKLDPNIKEAINKLRGHLLLCDKKARKVDLAFYDEINKARERLSKDYDDKDVKVILDKVNKDYEDKLNSKIFEVVKFMKDYEYKRDPNITYGASNALLKARKARKKNAINKLFDKFISNIGRETTYICNKSRNRLREIETSINKTGSYNKGGK